MMFCYCCGYCLLFWLSQRKTEIQSASAGEVARRTSVSLPSLAAAAAANADTGSSTSSSTGGGSSGGSGDSVEDDVMDKASRLLVQRAMKESLAAASADPRDKPFTTKAQRDLLRLSREIVYSQTLIKIK